MLIGNEVIEDDIPPFLLPLFYCKKSLMRSGFMLSCDFVLFCKVIAVAAFLEGFLELEIDAVDIIMVAFTGPLDYF